MKKHTTILSLALIAMIGLNPVVVAGDADTVKRQNYFNKWDADGDGQLNSAEFTTMTETQFAKKGKEGAEAEAAKRFERRDADGDGFVTFDEFSQNKKGM